MENKIVLELISKNLEEIEFLFENMKKGESIDPLLIEITALKAKTLYQELKLLLPKESSIRTNDLILDKERQIFIDQNDSIVQKQDEMVAEIYPDEPPFSEEPSIAIVESPEMQIPIANPEVVLAVETQEEVLSIENIDETLEEQSEIGINDSPIIENNEFENQEQELISSAQVESEAELQISDEVAQDPIIVSVNEEQPVTDETIEDVTEEMDKEVVEEESDDLIEHISETANEAPTITEVLIEEEHESIEKKVFGEQFSKEPSLNDKLASTNLHELKIKAQPILSIKGAIGLNDRFLFTRELFGNDISRFESTIEHLDQSATILEAVEFLESNFQWTKSDTSLKFMNLVKRRFDN